MGRAVLLGGFHAAGRVALAPLERLRTAAFAALIGGAAASAGLMLHAGQRVRAPRLLLVLFTGWVLLPFVVVATALVAAKRWSLATRTTLYIVTLIVAAASLSIYGVAALSARRPPTVPFVLTAPASCLFIALVVPGVALRSRKPRVPAGGPR